MECTQFRKIFSKRLRFFPFQAVFSGMIPGDICLVTGSPFGARQP